MFYVFLATLSESLESLARMVSAGESPQDVVLGARDVLSEGTRRDARPGHSDLLLSPSQCHFCDKAFMNQAFLQSHVQRRHPEDSHLGKSAGSQRYRAAFFPATCSFFFFPKGDMVPCISQSF